MKKQMLVAAIAALSVAGISVAEPPKGKGKRGGSPEARAEKMIQNGDKDGDGKLDKDELVALFKQMAERRAAAAARKKNQDT